MDGVGWCAMAALLQPYNHDWGCFPFQRWWRKSEGEGGRKKNKELGAKGGKVEGGEGGRRMDSIDVDEPFDVRYIYTWYLVWRL